MRSVEEIKRKLEDVQRSPADFGNDVIIDYLNLALDKNNPEYWIQHLLTKYTFDTKEDAFRIRTLEWVLNKRDEI